MILGEVKARPKDIISFSLDYISKSKVQTSNPSSSPISLDTPARPADSRTHRSYNPKAIPARTWMRLSCRYKTENALKGSLQMHTGGWRMTASRRSGKTALKRSSFFFVLFQNWKNLVWKVTLVLWDFLVPALPELVRAGSRLQSCSVLVFNHSLPSIAVPYSLPGWKARVRCKAEGIAGCDEH